MVLNVKVTKMYLYGKTKLLQLRKRKKFNIKAKKPKFYIFSFKKQINVVIVLLSN